MPQTVTIQDKQLPVRPLHVLVPLIKADLEEAKTASERAGEPYYIAAGQKMLEAKGQMSRGEFGPWLTRHFKLSLRHAQRWMAYSIATGDTPKTTIRQYQRIHARGRWRPWLRQGDSAEKTGTSRSRTFSAKSMLNCLMRAKMRYETTRRTRC